MAGKTLTLLEICLLRKSQGKKIKNNKLLFQTGHIYMIYIFSKV